MPHKYLEDQTLFMIFYNQSLRTRNSFEAGMTQLGGHAHFLDPDKIYTPALEGEEVAYSTERISDVARVLDRMGHGISIRMYGDPVGWVNGKANRIVREFAHWAEHVPVINMECDIYHPCQGMADIMTVREHFGGFKGVKFVMSWAYSPSVHKPLSVPHSAVIAAATVGCDVVLAHPEGLELDDDILAATRKRAEESGGSFEIIERHGGGLRGRARRLPEGVDVEALHPADRGRADAREDPGGLRRQQALDLRRGEDEAGESATSSTCTACRATAATRSPTRSSTVRTRSCSTRRRTDSTRRRPSWP